MPYKGLVQLRDGGAYETEALTGRAGLFTGLVQLRDRRLYIRDEPDSCETGALTGRVPYGTRTITGQRRWDEPPYGTLLQLRDGGNYGTCRRRDSYGTEALSGRVGLLQHQCRSSIRRGADHRDLRVLHCALLNDPKSYGKLENVLNPR